MSLRRLRLERIDLYQLHRVDPQTPLEESLAELQALQDEGKIRYIGLSEVDVDVIERAREVVDVVTVQNIYNLTERRHETVVDYCEREGLGFIPWFPLATGQLAAGAGPLTRAAQRHDRSPSQLALAWTFHQNGVTSAIAGSRNATHMRENAAAGSVELDDKTLAEIEEILPLGPGSVG